MKKEYKDKPVVTGSHPPVTNTEKDPDDLAHEKGTLIPRGKTKELDPDDLAHQTGNRETHDKNVIPGKNSGGFTKEP